DHRRDRGRSRRRRGSLREAYSGNRHHAAGEVPCRRSALTSRPTIGDKVWAMNEPPLRLYTFGPAWGLPTIGPFGLKLEACLRMLELPYERVVENDPRKGPKGKSPWIEDGGVRIGDTECVLQYLGQKRGIELDRDLSPVQRARGHMLRRALEEHFH